MPTTGPHSPELSAGKLRTPGARIRVSEGLCNMAQTLTNISPVAPVGGYKPSGTVNGVQMLFLLDTGAAVTLLRKDVWDRVTAHQP